MFENLKADAQRYADQQRRWYSERGFWIGANYRLGRWAHVQAPALLRKPLSLVHKLTSLPLRTLINVELAREADIGPGLLLLHPHSILIPAGSKLGSSCSIYHDVTLGRGGPTDECPQLEDHVVVFSGARLLGGIHVGARAEIGPNAVVQRDIPAGAAFGVAPSRLVPAQMLDATRQSQRSGTGTG